MSNEIIQQIQKRSAIAILLNQYPEEYSKLFRGRIDIESAQVEDLKDLIKHLEESDNK